MTPEELEEVKKVFKTQQDKENLSYKSDICNVCGTASNVHRIQGGYAKYCNKCIEKFGLIKVEDYD